MSLILANKKNDGSFYRLIILESLGLLGVTVNHVCERSRRRKLVFVGVNNLEREREREREREKENIPFETQCNEVNDINVSCDKQTCGPFIPIGKNNKFRDRIFFLLNCEVYYQRAVAAKHMVLPTYIGSRRTLKGNLIDKTNELDLKNSKRKE